MNIKIQGGGSGTYANTGSCTGVTTYLQHEDLERMKNGQEVQPFFNNSRDYISAQEVTFKIDNNKAKLRPERCEVLCDHGKPFQPGAGENGQDREGTG